MTALPFRLCCTLLLGVAASSAEASEAGRIHAFAPGAVHLGAKSDRGLLEIEVGEVRLRAQVSPNETLLGGLPPSHRDALALAGQLFLEGSLDGVEGSWLRLSRVDGQWGGAWFDGKELFLIDASAKVAAQLGESAPGKAQFPEYVVYQFRDIELPGPIDQGPASPWSHAAPREPARMSYRRFADHLGGVAKGVVASKQLDMTVVTDTQYGSRYGGSRDAVTAAQVNTVDGIYASQLGVRIRVAHLQNLTNNGGMTATAAGALLDQFSTYLSDSPGNTIPRNGLTHLLTARNLDGSTRGIAYVGVLCNAWYGIGLSEITNNDQVSSLVLAHELGHNFGADHDGESGEGRTCPNQTGTWLMSPTVGGTDQFSPCSVNVVSQQIASASCLVNLPPPNPDVLFENGFEG